MRGFAESLEARRLLANYVVDLTWNGGELDVRSDGQPAVYVRDGRLVTIASYSDEAGFDQTSIQRFHADGSEDEAFSEIAQYGYHPTYPVGVDATARPLFGFSGTGSARLTRYKPGGGGDRNFVGRLAPPDAAGKTVDIESAEPQADGSLLVLTAVITPAGKNTAAGYHLYLSRLSPAAGTVDTRLSGTGYYDLGTTNDPSSRRYAADRLGRIYLSTPDTNGVYRVRANGSRDRAYGARGTAAAAVGPYGGFVIDSADRVLAFSTSNDRTAVTRVDTTGRPDTAFNANVRAVLDAYPYATLPILPQPDGTLYVQAGNQLLRLGDNGRLDTGFDRDGKINMAATAEGYFSGGAVIAALPGGRFLRRYGESVYALAPFKPVVSHAGGVVITAAAADDSVALRTEGANLRVSLNGDVYRVPAAGITRIQADLGDGDNVFTSTLPVDTVVTAGDGDNTIYTGTGSDFVVTGNGDDTVATGDRYDYIRPGGGDNFSDGGRGGAELRFDDTDPAGHQVLIGRGGGWEVDATNGSTVDIRLTGQRADITLGGGDDVVRLAMTGEVFLSGGGGRDLIDTTGDGLGPAGSRDQIESGPGRDTVRTGSGNDRIDQRVQDDDPGPDDDDFYDLGDGDDVAVDPAGNDTVYGGPGNDSFYTADGRDLLDGGAGDDTLYGDTGRDTLRGGPGTDSYRDAEGDDVLDRVEERLTP